MCEKAFKPIALELGWLVFHWNNLQEDLSYLFADLSDNGETAHAIWHSAVNDRPQREMLRSAAETMKASSDPEQQRFCEGVLWILNELNSLAGRRNDALHAPLVFIPPLWPNGPEVEIEPNSYTGNPRAKSLKRAGEPLWEIFAWYRTHIAMLAGFSSDLHYAWMFRDRDEPYPWPDTPQLPPRGQFRSRRKSRRKNETTQPQRQLESSRG
jgi:hypothetical protein